MGNAVAMGPDTPGPLLHMHKTHFNYSSICPSIETAQLRDKRPKGGSYQLLSTHYTNRSNWHNLTGILN